MPTNKRDSYGSIVSMLSMLVCCLLVVLVVFVCVIHYIFLVGMYMSVHPHNNNTHTPSTHHPHTHAPTLSHVHPTTTTLHTHTHTDAAYLGSRTMLGWMKGIVNHHQILAGHLSGSVVRDGKVESFGGVRGTHIFQYDARDDGLFGGGGGKWW